jgi:hypothetical protein
MNPASSVPRPPSSVGQNAQGNVPPALAALRRGTSSPRIPGSNPSGMPPPQTPLQRMPSGGFNPGAGGTPQQQQHSPMTPQHLQNMTPQQRHIMMQQQQQQQFQQQQRAMFNGVGAAAGSPGPSSMEPPPVPIRASSLSRATQSPTDVGSPSNPQSSFNIAPPHQAPNQPQQQNHGMPQHGGGVSPINTMMASRAHSQTPGMGWSGNPGSAGGPGGYVGSPLNPSWSPQATNSTTQQHHIAATSPLSGGGGYGIGTSPARSHSDATPHHPGTPVTMQHQQQMLNYDLGANNDYSGSIDPSTLFTDWTAGGSQTM